MTDNTIDLIRDFGDEIKEGLAQLAKGLGVAAEYVFTLLVRQQYVEGITMLLLCIGWMIFGIVAYSLYIKFLFKPMVQGRIAEYNGDARGGIIAGFCVLTALLILDFGLSFYHGIFFGLNKLINPEYYALKQVLEMVQQAVK